MKRTTLCATAVLLLVFAGTLGGCPGVTDGTTQGTSLQGNWKAGAVGGTALPVDVTLTINASNRVTNISVQPQGVSVPPPVPVVAQVNGNAVSIDVTFPLNLGSLSFEGTLNAAGTVITGTITVRLNNIPGAPPEVSSAGTLTKQ